MIKKGELLLSGCLLLAALIAILWVGTAFATVEKLTLKELTNRATTIVRGVVVGLKSHWDEDHALIYTSVTISVTDYLKGGTGVRELTIEVPGGEVGEIALMVSGVPRFAENEEVILFLGEYIRGLYVVGGFQGKYTIVDDIVVQTGMPVNRFADQIQAMLEGDSSIIYEDAYLDDRTLRKETQVAIPHIDSISPDHGPAHADRCYHQETCAADSTRVTIRGSNFGATQGSGYVRFPGSEASPHYNACVESWSDAQIVARVPGGASSGDVVVVTNGGTSNGVYFTVTYSYRGGKWPKGNYPQPMPEEYKVNPSHGPPGALAVIQAAAGMWNDVGSADFFFRYGGTTSKTGPEYDDENTVLWWDGLPPDGNLAENWYWCDGNTNTLLEFDLVFNPHYDWATDCSAGTWDVQENAAHELGHALPLGDLYGAADQGKIMYGVYNSGDCVRNLHPDDIAGISYIYPTAPCLDPPATPSNPSPADGARDVFINADLTWSGGHPCPGEAVTYDIYLEVNDSTPDELICDDVSSPFCDPGVLSFDTHYYWKVVANGLNGPSPGPVWDFTTKVLTLTPSVYLPLITRLWPPIPDVPVLNPIALGNYGRYTISWTSSQRATSYTLEEASSHDFDDARIIYHGWDTSHTITGQSPGAYFYRVKATNSWGNSGWSNAQTIFHDNFSDPSSGWDAYENEAERWRYVGGRYEGTIKWPGYIAYERSPIRSDNYTLQAEVYPVGAAGEGSYGLVFGLSEDWTQYYEFTVAPLHGGHDGFYRINKRTSAGWTTLRDWTEHSVSPTHVRLKVVRQGSNIDVYIDDIHVDTVYDGELTGLRRVGVVVRAFDDASGPVTAQFDDFMLTTSAE